MTLNILVTSYSLSVRCFVQLSCWKAVSGTC